MKKRAQTKVRPLYSDLKNCIVLLSTFANRWACHDEHCAWNLNSAPCTCGYDLAVKTLDEQLHKKGGDDSSVEAASRLIAQAQRVIT